MAGAFSSVEFSTAFDIGPVVSPVQAGAILPTSPLIGNTRMSGVCFHRGLDATADMLNAYQQYMSTEITHRTRDITKTFGLVYGLAVVESVGQNVIITKGTAIDQQGARLTLKTNTGIGVVPPALENMTDSFYLCVRAKFTSIRYDQHPYDGSRYPMESVIGLDFFTNSVTDLYTSFDGIGIYPKDNNGIVLARLTQAGTGYAIYMGSEDRSPLYSTLQPVT